MDLVFTGQFLTGFSPFFFMRKTMGNTKHGFPVIFKAIQCPVCEKMGTIIPRESMIRIQTKPMRIFTRI